MIIDKLQEINTNTNSNTNTALLLAHHKEATV